MTPYYHPTPTRTPQAEAWATLLDPIAALVTFFIPRLDPALAPLLLAIRAWLFRNISRLDRLAQRAAAGTLPKPRPSRAGATRARKPPRPDRPTIRTHRFWLIRLVQRTAQYTLRLDHILTRDDIKALVQAAPQAGRLIRPMCRAFDVRQPDWLQLPPRPRKPRPDPAPEPPPAPEPKPKRFRPQLPGMLPTDRPLPPRVVAAARYYRKKYGPGG